MKRAVAAGLLVGTALFVRDAGACSCVPPDAALLAPDRSSAAPLNAKVRIEVASYGKAPVPVLRVHGGADVPVKTRKLGGGDLDVLELTPVTPLAPATQYEVATVDDARHPPIHVLGTFKTGASPDTTPPRIERMGNVAATRPGSRAMSSSCGVPGPWVTVDELEASDPGRPDAQLAYAVWLGDASGKIDDTKPPTRILAGMPRALVIGRSSLCDPHDFPFPATTHAWLGIAAIDEAGNTSALRKVKVDLKAGKP